MRLSFISTALTVCASTQLAAAAAVPTSTPLAPALPLSAFNNTLVHLLTLEEVLSGAKVETKPATNAKIQVLAAAAQCSNPRVRVEWDSLTTAQRTNFVTSVKCLLGNKASGQFKQAKNRYEDLVALHQDLTLNVHTNSKFLIWHRYYLWTFEDIMRTECGFTAPLPWFDETKYSGKFASSSIFSADWFGAINVGGNCVTNGVSPQAKSLLSKELIDCQKFAGLTLNVGPGTGNGAHCLARNNDDSKTINTNAQMVSGCNARSTYSDMAACSEGAAHAWGHNGIGAVMQDVYASPGDPVFFLHHAFIDRNFRIWQNANPARASSIDGTDKAGNPLTLQMSVSVNGLRPNVVIGDIIDTLGTKLCYKYNY
jgi:tyrosinase